MAEPERFLIEARYYQAATGQLEEEAAVYRRYAQTYPRDPTATVNLAGDYSALGQFDNCLAAASTVTEFSPTTTLVYFYSMFCAAALNRLQEAKDAYGQTRAHNAGYMIHFSRYFVAFLENDNADMDRQVSWSANSELASDVLSLEGATNAFYGKIVTAQEFNRRAADLAESNNEKPTAAGYKVEMAVTAAEVGYKNLATRLVKTAPESSLSSLDRAHGAIALARAGDSRAAQEILEKLKRQYPLDTMVNYGVQTAEAAIELSHDNAKRASG